MSVLFVTKSFQIHIRWIHWQSFSFFLLSLCQDGNNAKKLDDNNNNKNRVVERRELKKKTNEERVILFLVFIFLKMEDE